MFQDKLRGLKASEKYYRPEPYQINLMNVNDKFLPAWMQTEVGSSETKLQQTVNGALIEHEYELIAQAIYDTPIVWCHAQPIVFVKLIMTAPDPV